MYKSTDRTKSGQLKDKRKPFSLEPLFVEGSFVGSFNGKFNPDTNTLKIYNYYGDITKFGAAIHEYAFDKKIDTIIVKFVF